MVPGDDDQQGVRLGPEGDACSPRRPLRCGDADIVIAGGQENMSASPHVLPGSRDGFRMGDAKIIDSMIVDGLWDVYNQYHMGVTAENVAKKYGISRARAGRVRRGQPEEGRGRAEGRPVQGRDRAGRDPAAEGRCPSCSTRTSIRRPAPRSRRSRACKPAFDKDGTVTAGNASGINDGAAAVIDDVRRNARRRSA